MIKYIIENYESERDSNGNRYFAQRITDLNRKNLEFQEPHCQNFTQLEFRMLGIKSDEIFECNIILPKREFKSMVKAWPYATKEMIEKFIQG